MIGSKGTSKRTQVLLTVGITQIMLAVIVKMQVYRH